jgi:hypothetical protein
MTVAPVMISAMANNASDPILNSHTANGAPAASAGKTESRARR